MTRARAPREVGETAGIRWTSSSTDTQWCAVIKNTSRSTSTVYTCDEILIQCETVKQASALFFLEFHLSWRKCSPCHVTAQLHITVLHRHNVVFFFFNHAEYCILFAQSIGHEYYESTTFFLHKNTAPNWTETNPNALIVHYFY